MDEEHAMQRSWRDDGDKLTFIICKPFKLEGTTLRGSYHNSASDYVSTGASGKHLPDELSAMVGDVNLFISLVEDEKSQGDRFIGELELMIAAPSQRRRGYGRAALIVFLNYIVRFEEAILNDYRSAQSRRPLPESKAGLPAQFDYFSVKIGATNGKSLALFEGLGFAKTTESANYFGEYELRLERVNLGDLLIDGRVGEENIARKILEVYEVKPYHCDCAACLVGPFALTTNGRDREQRLTERDPPL